MIHPITPTPFTDWCAEKMMEGEQLFLRDLPPDRYWPTIDEAAETTDRLTAALSRKVPVTMGGR